MIYRVMQQRHKSITAKPINDSDFNDEKSAWRRRDELTKLHGDTHFFWISVLVFKVVEFDWFKTQHTK